MKLISFTQLVLTLNLISSIVKAQNQESIINIPCPSLNKGSYSIFSIVDQDGDTSIDKLTVIANQDNIIKVAQQISKTHQPPKSETILTYTKEKDQIFIVGSEVNNPGGTKSSSVKLTFKVPRPICGQHGAKLKYSTVSSISSGDFKTEQEHEEEVVYKSLGTETITVKAGTFKCVVVTEQQTNLKNNSSNYVTKYVHYFTEGIGVVKTITIFEYDDLEHKEKKKTPEEEKAINEKFQKGLEELKSGKPVSQENFPANSEKDDYTKRRVKKRTVSELIEYHL